MESISVFEKSEANKLIFVYITDLIKDDLKIENEI